MSKLIEVCGVRVSPIKIREEEQSDLFNLLAYSNLDEIIVLPTREILQNMISSGLTAVPDRQAVWMYVECIEGIRRIDSFHEPMGRSFPLEPLDFDEACREFSKEKVRRTVGYNLLCSHMKRDLSLNRFGGSSRLVFEIMLSSGLSRFITLVSAPSGLKEWEDLALGLGVYYYHRFISFDDLQVRNILKAADDSVADEPEFQPKDITITEYVKKVFTLIDNNRL